MKDQVQANYDQLATRYAARYKRPTTIRDFEKIRRMELVAEYTQLLEPEAMLDAGCGPGIVLSELSNRLPGSKSTGADLSYLMLKQAQANNLGGRAFVQSLVEQMPFADDSFDLIYALGVLDYLEKPTRLFETVRRILRPGGHFIFTYPNGNSLNRMLLISLRTYVSRFTRRPQSVVSSVPIKSRTIDQLIVEFGFELLRQHFITYGNGRVSLPWSIVVSQKMEKWCNQRSISRYLAWSGLCVVRKSTA